VDMHAGDRLVVGAVLAHGRCPMGGVAEIDVVTPDARSRPWCTPSTDRSASRHCRDRISRAGLELRSRRGMT
jgi:hypothetical protein